MEKKFIPEVESKLRYRSVKVPESIYRASGIKVLNKRIKSLIFTTDVAILSNNNADAVMAVYPFTPTLAITDSIIRTSSRPVFAGVGGGLTSGIRSMNMALQAELMGAYGVVVNAPIKNEVIGEMKKILDIPICATVVSYYDDIEGKIDAGAEILNISGGRNTISLVKKVREIVGPEFPIIATGGSSEATIGETIDAGANAITYTAPSSAEIFHTVMANYRVDKREEQE
ncbi:MAG: hydrolase [Tissierellia bacterium]|nr:hydrolase [Tissierellia bacterium]